MLLTVCQFEPAYIKKESDTPGSFSEHSIFNSDTEDTVLSSTYVKVFTRDNQPLIGGSFAVIAPST